MTPRTTRPRPVVMLASRQTGELKELETALYSAGYRVLSARTEHETLEKVHSQPPDAVVMDRDLTARGYELCRTLRDDPVVSPATPIMVTQSEAPSQANRLDALRAGAWDIQVTAPDAQELLLRLGMYVQAKRELDQLTAECLIDRGSGLYNPDGFSQRAAELAALTTRQGTPAACAVFQPADPLPSRASGDEVGRAFKAIGRLSDAIGRTAVSEFAIFAPATNDWAASRLVRRLRDNVTQEVGYIPEYGKRVTLRAAYSASAPNQKVEADVLLKRARQALEPPAPPSSGRPPTPRRTP